MIRGLGALHFFNSSDSHRLIFSLTVPAACALALGLAIGAPTLFPYRIAGPDAAGTPAAAFASGDAPNSYGALLVDLRSHAAPVSLAHSFPPEWLFQRAALASAAEFVEPGNAAPPPPASVSQTAEGAPLPPPRPAELAAAAGRGSPQPPLQRLAEPARKPALLPPSATSSAFFEKFFGFAQPANRQPAGTALAYAAPETGLFDRARKILSGPMSRFDQWTAVYDISTHTVHLPNGTKLEAHSGLGRRMDDPRYVHEKMRGATPPAVYELSLRERLFHGVQALRLAPVDDGRVYGRTGLLAHSYMLGPRGDSNGCVVFRNYGAFLQAFQNGEVKRLAVVARMD
jgi:hypothetical protein